MLYKARNAINHDDTCPLSLADVGLIIFGGAAALSDGTTIELEEALTWHLTTVTSSMQKRSVVIFPVLGLPLKKSQT